MTLEPWHLTVVDSYRDLSRTAADVVVETLTGHPASAITLPTGETPRGMYEDLVRRVREGTLAFGDTQFFCLDDYLGRGPEDEHSLTRWLQRTFLTPAAFPERQTHFIPAMAEDPVNAARDYDDAIAEAGGLQLAIVGLGPNGHIGFNEPGSPPDSRTRVVDLTEESRAQNAGYFEDRTVIPAQAITMGIGTILRARRIVLIASGKSKAEIVRQALLGPVTGAVPGSFMRMAGDRLEVILDADAACSL